MNNEIQQLIDSIKRCSEIYAKQNDSYINLMEVCGTHTMSIARYGIRQMLPDNIKLLSGPGCPVCVTPNESIDYMIELSRQPDTIVTTFGDMMRVPGSSSSLLKEKANGADIRVVYSPVDALSIAKEASQNDSNKHVVFLGVGFETTTPATAATIIRAQAMGLDNFTVYSAHKNMPGALELISNDDSLSVSGLILPGHVATIVGLKPFDFLAENHSLPGVVSGFQPQEILSAVALLCKQVVSGEAQIQNAYENCVRDNGNENAQKLIEQVFETSDSTWRGLGEVADSGYKIRSEFEKLDAEIVFDLDVPKSYQHSGCKCGEILKGKIAPNQCPLFGKKCTTENPVGPCMVSNEGTCAAYYRYLSN